MYAMRSVCIAVTFSIIDGLPGIDLAIPPTREMSVQHLGKHDSDGVDIDGDTAHGYAIHPLQCLFPSQKLAIDVADVLEEPLQLVVVGQGFRDLSAELLGNVLLLRSLSRIADGQVVLGAMARPLGALASRFSTAEETFDQAAAKDAWTDGSDTGEQRGSSSAKGRCGLLL